ncbi:MAG: site-specific integrase, partial [Flavobacteriales bacterium]
MDPSDQFIIYLRTEKRCSEHTLIAYKTDLRQFKEYLEDEFDLSNPEGATNTMVRSWLVQLNEFDYESKSIHRKLSTLRSFFKFLRREGVTASDPLLKIRAPKLKKRLPIFIDERGMKKLLDEVEYPEGWQGKRDHLIVTLFYETGIRQAELIALKRSDVNRSGTIKVLGKRNKERIIPISSFCQSLIKSYCEAREKEMVEAKNVSELFL